MKPVDMRTEAKRKRSKVFWLSFCDAEQPKGKQFLGACVVEVTAAEADQSALDVISRFPNTARGAEWIAAALKKAHALRCNPGGDVASVEIGANQCRVVLKHYRLGVLMDRAEIARLDRLIGDEEGPQ